MKKLFTITALMTIGCIAFNATAQLVTISETHQIPAIGDTVHYVDANSFGFDATGTGPVTAKVWDNSTLMNAGTFYNYSYVDPATVPVSLGRDSFPTATIARGESGATGYFYYNNTVNNIDRVGWFGSNSNFGIYEDNTVATEFHFPITAGNSVNSTYYGRFAPFNVGEDSVNIESGSLTITADMQGLLKLPTGDFNNVLRLHVIEIFHIKTYLFGLAVQDDIVQDDYYYWFTDTVLSAILVSGVTSINGSAQPAVLRYQPISGTTGIATIDTKVSAIYPNPSNGKFIVENYNNQLANSGFDIFNLLGEKVYAGATINSQSKYEVDMTRFDKGMYFVKIYDGNKIIHTEKIVIN